MMAIIFTALLASLFTMILLFACYFHYLKPVLDQTIDALAKEIEARVKKGVMDGVTEYVDENIERIGDTLQTRVKQGVMAGVASIPSAETLHQTTVNLARTGADIINTPMRLLKKKNPYGDHED